MLLKWAFLLEQPMNWSFLSNNLKFGFIKRVDKGEITTVKDLESWRFER